MVTFFPKGRSSEEVVLFSGKGMVAKSRGSAKISVTEYSLDILNIGQDVLDSGLCVCYLLEGLSFFFQFIHFNFLLSNIWKLS